MKKRYPKVRPVVVRWLDSTSTSGWNVKPGASLECVTVGHILKKNKERISLCMNRSEHGNGEIMEIPICAVKKIKRL